ncbi:MAG TPA: hypothetical protein EYN46_03510 [Candidatus Poseidoniales archaeon]|nr:MAG: hypothetical protein CXX80_07090 [Euryarchaeota archaeon]HIO94401.1 hypothetical protein [Candidatus Poseidoniales archaeon]
MPNPAGCVCAPKLAKPPMGIPRLATPLLVVLLLSSSLAGCLTTGSGDDGYDDDGPIESPQWEVGQWWLYTFITPEFGEDSARLVVAENNTDESAWMLGISNLKEAQRHAVVNHNPFLGRMTWDNLSAYENGIPQPVFSFPLTTGKTWEFTLFGASWNAEVVSTVGREATVVCTGDGGEIIYTFSRDAAFFTSFTYLDADGEYRLQMQMNGFGSHHEGDVWFIRATDLFDVRYDGLDGEAYDSFFDSGHPSGADFDMLVWYLDVEINGGASQGSLTVKDHSGVTPLARAWGPSSTEKGSLGTIPANSGEYSVTASLNGGSSYIHLKIAGGLQSSWTL